MLPLEIFNYNMALNMSFQRKRTSATQPRYLHSHVKILNRFGSRQAYNIFLRRLKWPNIKKGKGNGKSKGGGVGEKRE